MAKKGKKESPLVAKEPAVSYGIKRRVIGTNRALQNKKPTSQETGSSIVYWVGSESTFNYSILSGFDLIDASVKGIPKASIDKLANHLGISRKSMAEDILDLSVKTLERKSPTDKLDRRTSSHALEIARLMQHGYEVFEDEEKLRRWINKENRALKGMKPIAFFNTLSGLNMVNDILGRIEEGVYS